MQVEVKYVNGETELFEVSEYATQDNGELDLFSVDDKEDCEATIAKGMWIRVKKILTGTDEQDVEADEELDFDFDPLQATKRKTATPREGDGLTVVVD